ncbi:hypothetical protein T439DRAFT_360177 [Meredithblackwellia eburnea MCA 4105]
MSPAGRKRSSDFDTQATWGSQSSLATRSHASGTTRTNTISQSKSSRSDTSPSRQAIITPSLISTRPPSPSPSSMRSMRAPSPSPSSRSLRGYMPASRLPSPSTDYPDAGPSYIQRGNRSRSGSVSSAHSSHSAVGVTSWHASSSSLDARYPVQNTLGSSQNPVSGWAPASRLAIPNTNYASHSNRGNNFYGVANAGYFSDYDGDLGLSTFNQLSRIAPRQQVCLNSGYSLVTSANLETLTPETQPLHLELDGVVPQLATSVVEGPVVASPGTQSVVPKTPTRDVAEREPPASGELTLQVPIFLGPQLFKSICVGQTAYGSGSGSNSSIEFNYDSSTSDWANNRQAVCGAKQSSCSGQGLTCNEFPFACTKEAQTRSTSSCVPQLGVSVQGAILNNLLTSAVKSAVSFQFAFAGVDCASLQQEQTVAQTCSSDLTCTQITTVATTLTYTHVEVFLFSFSADSSEITGVTALGDIKAGSYNLFIRLDGGSAKFATIIGYQGQVVGISQSVYTSQTVYSFTVTQDLIGATLVLENATDDVQISACLTDPSVRASATYTPTGQSVTTTSRSASGSASTNVPPGVTGGAATVEVNRLVVLVAAFASAGALAFAI